jgi:hypothetical protein
LHYIALFENDKKGQIFRQLFSVVKLINKFGQKMGLATFWEIFSQTHLVALLVSIRLLNPNDVMRGGKRFSGFPGIFPSINCCFHLKNK